MVSLILATLLLATLGFWLYRWWPRLTATGRNASSVHCEGCGYDLRASPVRCPECGRAVEAESPPADDFGDDGTEPEAVHEEAEAAYIPPPHVRLPADDERMVRLVRTTDRTFVDLLRLRLEDQGIYSHMTGDTALAGYMLTPLMLHVPEGDLEAAQRVLQQMEAGGD